LEEDFDVQRDHANLLALAANLLAPEGSIVFSNNYTRFKLDPQIADSFTVEDWSQRTLPWDFRRNPRIHRCFKLQLSANAAQRSAAS
jgi:23S rRNA (guanine2445-N2)-methyltransferase / 23S rRNA (guanine2069-N7)-methyltransferase